jgi:4,5-dihydroxyphthalate decarboxylase
MVTDPSQRPPGGGARREPTVPLTLKTAIGTYPHTVPLKDGSITSPRVCLEHVEVVPANRAFRPMINQLAYDVSEMALVTLMLGKAFGRRVTGVPVILMQQSAYGMLMVRPDSPLRDPRELAGKTIGVRSYSQTTGVWLRGQLNEQFGLDLSSLRWVTFEASHVDGYVDPPSCTRAPDGATLAGMLRAGEIDAAAGLEPAEHPDLRTLMPNAVAVEQEWIAASGIRPLNHTLVLRSDLVMEHPWLGDELFDMVGAAKQRVGSGPPDGVEQIRPSVEVLARYAFEQDVTERALTIEELYSTG